MPDDAPVTTATEPADGGGIAMKLTLVQADVSIDLNRRTPRRGLIFGSGLQVEPFEGWGRRHRRHGLVDNAAERLGHRHGPCSPLILRVRTMINVSFSKK